MRDPPGLAPGLDRRAVPWERGFSLMEVLVALAISVIAVVGLAYSFGMGRAFINRFEVARAALGAAQDQMETLAVLSPSDALLAVGPHSRPFLLGSDVVGTVAWNVTLVGASGYPGTDLKQVSVMVSWTQGTMADTIHLSRLFPRQ